MAVCAVGAANATVYVYVGSWEVDQGPSWTVVPPAYTGQQAAALLFGGSPANYVVSSVDSNPVDINFQNWVSTWGGACGDNFPCGTLSADNFVVSTAGFYQNPGDTSSYVQDWEVGSQYTNYAFSAVPEPATWAMMLVGFAMFGFAAYRQTKKSQPVLSVA